MFNCRADILTFKTRNAIKVPNQWLFRLKILIYSIHRWPFEWWCSRHPMAIDINIKFRRSLLSVTIVPNFPPIIMCLFISTHKTILFGTSIAQWICLHLPSCGSGSNPKNKQKRGRVLPILKKSVFVTRTRLWMQTFKYGRELWSVVMGEYSYSRGQGFESRCLFTGWTFFHIYLL